MSDNTTVTPVTDADAKQNVTIQTVENLGKLVIPEIGTLQIVVKYGFVEVTGRQSVLFNGILHSVNARYAKHGDRYYPISPSVLSANGMTKRPSKASGTLLDAISAHVNDYITANPGLFLIEQRVDRKHRLEYAERDATYQAEQITRYTQQLASSREKIVSLSAELATLEAKLIGV